MKTPAFLRAAALVFWGFAGGNVAVGASLAVIVLIVGTQTARGRLRLTVADEDVLRVVDLTQLSFGLMVAALLASKGLPDGLLVGVGWLPVVMLPLLLLQTVTSAPVKLRYLAWSMRNSTRPDADQAVDIGSPWLATTLLSAAILAGPSLWFFWALALLLLAWLFVARAPLAGSSEVKRVPSLGFIAAGLVTVALAFFFSIGLERAQLAAQEWFVETLTGSNTDPYQNETSIGDLGRVKLSDQIVWRVKQPSPAIVPLLLRSGVFSQFDGRRWTSRQDAFKPFGATNSRPNRIDSNDPNAFTSKPLILRGDSRKGAALIPLPANAAGVSGNGGRLERNPYGIMRISDAPGLLELAIQTEANPTQTKPLPIDLAVSDKFRSLLSRLPEVAALQSQSEAARLSGLREWFAANFRYTLFLGDEATGARDIERFLLTDRAGHCEYFATASVLLLRSLGIPARYVTGYSVQEFSRLERIFVVRQSHAHAWTEAYIDGRWVEFDTTPTQWLEEEAQQASPWRPVFDWFDYVWRSLQEWRQGFVVSDHIGGLALTGLLLLAVLVGPAIRRSRMARSKDAVVAVNKLAQVAHDDADANAFQQVEVEFAKLGLARAPSEPPRSWLRRAAKDGASVLSSGQLISAAAVIEALYRRRYGIAAADK